MDEIDRKILDILEDDARTSFVEIGKNLGISEATVRNRVKALVKSGQIKKFTIIRAAKERMMTVILVSTASKSTREVGSRIRKLENVKNVYEVSGDFDIICIAEADAVAKLNRTVDAIRKIKDVTKTITNLVLK